MQSVVMEELELGIVMPTKNAFKPGDGAALIFMSAEPQAKFKYSAEWRDSSISQHLKVGGGKVEIFLFFICLMVSFLPAAFLPVQASS